MINRMIRKMTVQILKTDPKERLKIDQIKTILEKLLEYSYEMDIF